MRIISGTARGRRLASLPKGQSIRPTTARVRESLFAILESRDAIKGWSGLDLYAGTGALGCEALSRGADPMTFVDAHRGAIATIRENLKRIGMEANVVTAELPMGLQRLAGQKFDLVLLDPPYPDRLVAATLRALVEYDLLAPEAYIAAEHPKAEPLEDKDLPECLTCTVRRTYGGTCLSLWEAP
jgi:16S rRNA (guanine966-N2)-methyltransferase